jgi:hypothetical protein
MNILQNMRMFARVSNPVLTRQHEMVGQHDARAHVDDHQQPHPLHFEFVFKAKRIAHHYF